MWSGAIKTPTFVVRYDGEPSVLLSVEMQKGKNIVQLGDQIAEVFARARYDSASRPPA